MLRKINRISFHILALILSHRHFKFHIKGILRELKGGKEYKKSGSRLLKPEIINNNMN